MNLSYKWKEEMGYIIEPQKYIDQIHTCIVFQLNVKQVKRSGFPI